MLRRFALFLAITLCLTPCILQAQIDDTDSQTGTSPTQTNDNCQDSLSATCIPQSATQPNSGVTGVSPYDQGNPTENSQQGAVPSGLPNLGAGQMYGAGSPYGTGNQPLTEPNYRDENALPNQSRYRQYLQRQTPPEPLTEFQQFVAETTGQVLPVFGERLFRSVPTTFAPVDQIPVPANGTIGPGDLLRIRVWGHVNFSANLRVDRSGDIYLPQIGPVHVAGLQYSDLEAHLRTAIGRVYRDFQVSAELGQIRSIQVYVVGRARRPGTYTVSSLSTLIDAIFASGGPALDGSLRHILLKRAGKTVTDLDLYQLLVNGDRSGDVPLQPGDVIFIPAAGPQIAVLGSVKTPAIYEEREPAETVEQLIMDAAGVTNVASGGGWTIERIVNRGARTVERIAYTPRGLATEVGDGDILRVEPAVPAFQNTVTLRGNTANPGRYSWKPGMRLSDLLPDRMALLTRNYWWQRTWQGLPAPEFERVPALGRLVQPGQPVTLPVSPGDRERLRQQQQRYLTELRQRELLAEQQNGGRLTAQQQQTDANLDAQELALGDQSGLSDPAAAESQMNGDSAYNNSNGNNNSSSNGYDNRTAPESAIAAGRDARTENTANAEERTQVTLPAPEIDWSYAVIERLDPDTLTTSLIPFDLGELVMGHDPAQNLLLHPGDVVTVFSQADIHVPMQQQTRFVKLEGEFAHSGVYSVRPGETLQEVVERAGGFSPGAYLFGSEFTRVSVRAVQQRRLDEYVQQLQLQLERGVLSTSASAASSATDLASATASASEARELIARLRQIRATGRIVLNLNAASSGVQQLPPLQLQDGDSFYVPSIPSSISVIGAVYDQNSFVFAGGDRVRDYVRMAGGANRNADKRHPFMIRADGSVVSRDQVGEKKFQALVVQPGDTIVISEKTFGSSKLRAFLDFSQLFSQLAIGAAVATNL